MIETDNAQVVAWLTRKEPWPWLYYHKLNEIQQILDSVQVSIFHIYREANLPADYLAKIANKHKDTVYKESTMEFSRKFNTLVLFDKISLCNIRTLKRK